MCASDRLLSHRATPGPPEAHKLTSGLLPRAPGKVGRSAQGGCLSILPLVPVTLSLPFIGEAAHARGKLARGQAVGQACTTWPLGSAVWETLTTHAYSYQAPLSFPLPDLPGLSVLLKRSHHHFLLLCFPKLCSGCMFLCWGFFVFCLFVCLFLGWGGAEFGAHIDLQN